MKTLHSVKALGMKTNIIGSYAHEISRLGRPVETGSRRARKWEEGEDGIISRVWGVLLGH